MLTILFRRAMMAQVHTIQRTGTNKKDWKGTNTETEGSEFPQEFRRVYLRGSKTSTDICHDLTMLDGLLNWTRML